MTAPVCLCQVYIHQTDRRRAALSGLRQRNNLVFSIVRRYRRHKRAVALSQNVCGQSGTSMRAVLGEDPAADS